MKNKNELSAIELVAQERQRQISKEGWSFENDDMHTNQQLATLAACYAMPIEQRKRYESYSYAHNTFYPRWFPQNFDISYWKPTPDNRIKELVKAAALLVAEIERLKRQANETV